MRAFLIGTCAFAGLAFGSIATAHACAPIRPGSHVYDCRTKAQMEQERIERERQERAERAAMALEQQRAEHRTAQAEQERLALARSTEEAHSQSASDSQSSSSSSSSRPIRVTVQTDARRPAEKAKPKVSPLRGKRVRLFRR